MLGLIKYDRITKRQWREGVAVIFYGERGFGEYIPHSKKALFTMLVFFLTGYFLAETVK